MYRPQSFEFLSHYADNTPQLSLLHVAMSMSAMSEP